MREVELKLDLTEAAADALQASDILAADPESAGLRGAVRLVAPDLPAAAISAALTMELVKRAPGVDLVFHPWHAGDEIERLERGEVDLVVTGAPFMPPRCAKRLLASILTQSSCDRLIRRRRSSRSISIAG